jgi:hypothetical protein
MHKTILRLLNLQLQRQRWSRLERFYVREKYFYYKTRHAISCAVNFYNAGVVTWSRRIGSRLVNVFYVRNCLNCRHRPPKAVLNFAERGLIFWPKTFVKSTKLIMKAKIWNVVFATVCLHFGVALKNWKGDGMTLPIAISRKRTMQCDFMPTHDALRFHANAQHIAISRKRKTHCDFAKTSGTLRFWPSCMRERRLQCPNLLTYLT